MFFMDVHPSGGGRREEPGPHSRRPWQDKIFESIPAIVLIGIALCVGGFFSKEFGQRLL
jgi:hypothetical protein